MTPGPEQQAQFSSDIQRLKEAHVVAESRQTFAESRLTRIEEAIVRLVNVVDQLATVQVRTDERLNVFIAVVGRYISERHSD